MLTAAVAAGGATPASAAQSVTLVDTLGAASPTTTFSVFGSGGWVVSANEILGPKFTLAQPTVITEIGGFLSTGFFGESTLPLVVEIRPSVGDAPDLGSVLGTFALSSDNQPLVISYESTSPNIVLPAGEYFALFAAQDGGGGIMLQTASIPFTYRAGLSPFGFVNVLTGATRASPGEYGAVRILGVLLPTSADDCKDEGWQAFGIFKNQGDCVSFVATHAKNTPA